MDVGCGDGLFFDVLAGYGGQVEGVEPDENLVSGALRAEGRIHVLPFDAGFRPERPYGLMLFLDVLEHIPDAEAAVAHAAELLDPGGVAVVTVPAFRHLWTTHDDLNRHVTRYTRGELIDLLEGPLRVETARYFFRWLHKAKVLVRLKEAATKPKPSPPRVPPAPLNTALYALSRLDEILLRGIPLPMGSSLLAIARKP